MDNICTSIEQSKILLELGLKPETADMFWEYHERWYSEGDEWEGYEDYPRAEPYCTYTRNDKEWENSKQDIPAWSLSALVELMPEKLKDYACKDHEVDLLIHKDGVEYFDQTGMQHGPGFKSNILDAAYEMIVWLLENKKI